MFENTTPEEAHKILEEDSETIYVDVRSVPEFVEEHPIRAVNIPLLHQSSMGGMEPNQDFLVVAQAVLPKDKKILMGCLRGGRSFKACQILEQSGFTNLYNVHGGFGGAVDPNTGQISQKGWKECELPTSTENGEGVSWESLKTKAG